MGGSFNPIHSRHLQIAESALTEAELSRVFLLPSGNPPHKQAGLEPAEDRYEMTRLGAAGKKGLAVSRMELDRQGVIYTVDTLGLLRRQYPYATFDYIIGEDTLLDLPNWRTPDKDFGMCRFLVCRRPGFLTENHSARQDLEARGAQFRYLSLPPVAISSTGIREALANGRHPPELPPQVMEYIRLMGLYGTPASPPNGKELYARLRGSLNEKRLLHSLLVAHTARLLARKHCLDENAAALSGLLHDCAKGLLLSQLQDLCGEYGLMPDEEAGQSEGLLHGPVGAEIAKRDYGVADPLVLSSIACHTTGKVGMTPMDMVLFLADKMEPSRRYPSLETIRSLSETSLHAATRLALLRTLQHVKEKNTTPCPVTRQTADWLAGLESQALERSKPHE